MQYSTIRNNFNPSQTNSGIGGNLYCNVVYKFTQKFTVSTLIGFWKDPQTIQITYPFYLWNNVAYNYKILKGKLSVSLRAVDWFEKTHDYNIITKDQHLYNSNVTTLITRGGVLALAWNFGKLTENVSNKRGLNNDDLLAGPAAPSVGN